jgi:hypothetical protein
MKCSNNFSKVSPSEFAKARDSLRIGDNGNDKLSLDLDNPWPLYDVLQKLIWASEYLLNEKSYDGGNYEEISHCVKRGKEILKKIKP